MVFESVVADVLNRFLGDYVENLDTSQLKIGIWGGDVVLENLILKENALEELNIPVQTVYGHLGKLVLKIPWKNLYGASVEATIENLFLIVNPTVEVKYNAEKEKKQQLASKQAELQRVEEAKRQEAQKDQKVDDSFVEKLVTQIIKNVQLKIKDIHIRYEDSITNPAEPFSCGVTLHNLSVHTTDDSWKQTVIQEAVTKIFKILDLVGLAVYLNPSTKLYAKMSKEEILSRMQQEIATKSSQANDFNYVLGPINSTAKLKLNPKPELDSPKFSIPKCILSLHMEQLTVCINKEQYQDIMKLADSMDRMSKGKPYRKYRPFLNKYKGHYKEWWKFAYTCVVEEDVRRRRKNWDWAHMLNHRTTCRDYALAYQNKLTCKGKVAKDQIALLEHCENKLDIFNLVVIRQRIELEVERLGKAQEEANKNKGWFRSWWGGSSTKDDELSENTAIMKQFEKAMTPEEKSKLFRAIDYQENSAPTHLPAQFVALECHFSLDRLAVAVTDKEKQVLLSELENVQLSIEQRPSADAIKVGVIMQEFTVLGVKQGLLTPKIVGSQLSTQSAANGFNLLNVTFETNPLSNDCGQRLQVSARPLRIVYDAQTVIEIVNVFQTPPDSTALKELQAVAGSKLSNLKEKSTLGMEHAVSQHAYIDLDIHLQSSYIVIPHGGLFTKEMSEACLVVNLGAISIKSEPRSQSALNVHSMHKEGLCDDEILKQVLDNTYDKFVLNLTDMQVLIAAKEEDWLTTIMSGDISPQHLLQPTTLRIQIHKCLITDDPRLPNMKVRGELEKIAITASEDRLLTLLELFVAMPLPESKPTPVLKRAESKGSNLSLFRYLDPAEKKKPLERSPLQNEQAVQLTLLDANFVMNDFIINICRKSTDSTTYDRMLEFTLETLEIQATQKTYTMDTLMRLGSLSLVHHRPDCKPIHVIETQLTNQSAISSLQERYLFTVSYTNVDKRSPDFRSHYCSVEQLIVLNFTTLRVLLHLEALQQLLVVANDYQNRISAVQGQKDRIASAGSPLPTIMEDQELTTIKSKASTVSKSTRSRKVETIQLKVKIKVDEVDICFETEERPLAEISWQGLHAGLIMKDSYKQIEASIEDMRVLDMNPKTMHKEILKIIGGNVLTVNIVLYNLAEYPDVSDTDISITAQINCMRIIFLNWFVTSMLEFLSNFQTAQQAIIDASAVAADAAKANLQSAYENSIKVSLSVELKAPIIVAPENSNSFDALMIDLGRMTLRNKFFTLDVPESKVNPVIVDELTLVLTNMKISCVSFSDAQYETRQETMLLQPTSFTLFVKRSLSSWFDPLPDLDVSGRLKSIEITIRQSDFKMIMRMLQENLTEGQINAGKPTSALPSGTKLTPKVSSASTSLSAKATSPCLVQASVEIRKAKAPRTKIKFSFAMDSLIIDLKNTMSVSKKIHNVPHTSMEDVGLARFGLSVLSVKGRMLSDESMHTSVLLVDCTLDDTRPHRGSRITRYLNRKPEPGFSLVDAPESSDKIRSMIDITYTQKPSDTFIDVRVYSFNLILAMDLLMRVLDFTTSSITPDVPSGDGQLTAKPSVKGRPSETSLKKKTTNAVVNEVSNAKKSMMTINIKVEKPDITLVESLEKKNCEALIMNMEIAFKMRMTQDRMVVDGSVSSLQLYTRVCTESNEGEVLQDDGQRRYVLEPCHLSLAAAQPEGAGMHVDIAVSDIKIVVSPATINLLNRVVATMTNSEEDTGENKNEIITYDDLWGKKSFDSNKYWFLTADVADDAILLEESSSVILKKWVSGEICMLSSPNIVLALEMSVGSESIPMLVMESSLQAQVKDWSSKLYLESTWSMQMSYYNIAKAVWEPLIEPVETLRDNKYTHTPWELRIEVQMSSNDDADLMRTLSLPDPTMSSVDTLGSTQTLSKTASKTVTISSSEPLEITATSTALDVLQQLGSSYSEATSPLQSDLSVLDKSSKTSQIMKYSGAPYVLHNNTGLTVCLRLKEGGDFSVYTSLKGGRPISTDYREVVLELGASVPLQLKHGALNLLSINANLPALQLYIQIKELSCELLIPVERADKRYFPLGAERNSTSDVAGQESRGIISEVTMHEGAINIYLRSVVQVRNTLLVGVTVYYMTASGNEVVSLGEVSPGDTMQLPLHAVHTPTAEIFFSVEGFTVSVSPFVWRDLQHEVKIAKLLHCESKDRTSSENAYIRVVGTMEQVYLEDTSRHTLASACFNIELRPAVLLQNCLPVDVQVSQVGHNRTQTYRPGEMFHLSFLSPTKADLIILLPNYLEKCWSCTSRLPDLNTEFSVWSFDSHDSPAKMTLDLGIHCINEDGTQKLSLYCPFWMLNKTGFSLAYRADDTGNVLYHPVDYKGPILFSFRAKNFFGKKKASIRIEYGDWCDKFSLDVAGSSGVVLCRNEGRVYQVAVHNHLTFNSLTKMVIFTPFFLIVNSAPFDIECQEQGRLGDAWLKVEKNSSTAHWPLSERDEKLLIVRVAGTTQVAAPFVYTEQHTTLLKLNNEYGGIQVETQLSEGGSYITLRQYRDGLAPALIVNYSRHEVIAYEKENVNVRKVPPMHNMLFTWDNPAGPRILIFEGYKKKEIENDLRKDGVGRFLINSDTNVYWVSFLDGMQRVILFTDDVLLAENAHTAGESGALDMEVTVAIHGVGLSLVNNHERQEILYISISNSGIIWERCKAGSRRFKRVDTVKAAMLEEAYQHYVQECQVAKSVVPGRVMLDNFTEVDFENMLILKPHPKTLRRMLEPGLWLSLGISAHRRQLHARLHRLQIDQQMPLPTFPVILAPVPPPRSVASEQNMKPFVEVSVVERIMEHTSVKQYKYFKLLVQEFHVKVDMGLVTALINMFPPKQYTPDEALEAFAMDLQAAERALEDYAAEGMANDQKHFYDNLHLSPLKVHVSFSMGSSTQIPTFVGTLLQSIGVTLTDMNDVIFKLGYYERNYEFLSQKELILQVSAHYTGQALQQLYVLVLGLDVLGNPYGLVIGLKKGVEDLFYEPFQGAIQGPGEFAEGLYLGVRSLLGHTVGGAAGAISRITGAMGHGLAALTLDDNYQKRRRDQLNKPPANLQEGLARSGKGLVMGVFDGVTGVFTKPITGAREQGVEGFFKGLGKGAVGLVARPTAGVVDFASGSLDAVKRAADISEDVLRHRPPRCFPSDGVVRPYSRQQAEGLKLLNDFEKGKYVSTDTYVTHVWVISKKELVLCTDKRIIAMERSSVFGSWQLQWTYLWQEIPDFPVLVERGLYIPTAKKKMMGLFSNNSSGKILIIYDEAQRSHLHATCHGLMRQAR